MKNKRVVHQLLLLCTLLFGMWIGTAAAAPTTVQAAEEAWASRDSHNLSGYTYYTKESEHFRMIWGN